MDVTKIEGIDLMSDALSLFNRKPSGELYFDWNIRILNSFFSRASDGEEVFLRVDSDYFDQIGQDIGGDAGFLLAVKTGPSSVNDKRRFVDKARELLHQRKSLTLNYEDPGDLDPSYIGSRAPTYLPYLAVLVRNFTKSNTNYYFNLTSDLTLDEKFNSSQMIELEPLWQDLMEWTYGQNGKFGFFRKRRLGGYRHIGLPGAQSIVKQTDLNNLPICFIELQLKAGTELSENRLVGIVEYLRTVEYFFTAGFKEALRDKEFKQPICEIIKYAFLDWDGSLPQKDRGVCTSTSHKNDFELGLSLIVNQTSPATFSPCWFIPPVQDKGNFELKNGDYCWSGRFSGPNGVSCKKQIDNQQTIWQLAGENRRDNLKFELECNGSEDTESLKVSLQLPRNGFWVLVWSLDQLSGDPQLIPSDLPAHGPAYLLASPSKAEELKQYFEQQNPDAEFIQNYGIPDNWIMLCIKDCTNLTTEQRYLPDGTNQTRVRRRMIRFNGGRTVQRGYSRMYLPYDLPSIELDSSNEIKLVASSGISIEEQFYELDEFYQKGGLLRDIKLIRSFTISQLTTGSANHRIQAFDSKGSLLDSVQLKVAGVSGDLIEVGDAVSLDKFGKVQSISGGLLGIEVDTLFNKNLSIDKQTTAISVQKLGKEVSFSVNEACLFRKFLDMLAQSGSLDIGVSKTVLRRQIQASNVALEPIFILLELQRLGHLELSTTSKGNIARVHAIPPRLYTLPINCSEHAVWGISGTLRLQHWESIAIELVAWLVTSVQASSGMYTWRLIIKDEIKAQDIAEKLGLKFIGMPALNMSNYSSDITEFGETVFQNTIESLGGLEDESHRFMVSMGCFLKKPTGSIPIIGELWRLQDLDIRFDKVHVLVKKGKYAFVRDSSWGKWLAIYEFAGWLRNLPEFGPNFKIPINYQKRSGKVWIPARLGFPNILERALVFCSGNSPSVISLKKINKETGLNEVVLSNSQTEVIRCSNFYQDMSDGKWLVYDYVPESVAKIIAEKLGATLYMCN